MREAKKCGKDASATFKGPEKFFNEIFFVIFSAFPFRVDFLRIFLSKKCYQNRTKS